MHEAAKEYPNAPGIACAVYVGLCWYLPKVMKGRKVRAIVGVRRGGAGGEAD